jgi:hypothetical protein
MRSAVWRSRPSVARSRSGCPRGRRRSARQTTPLRFGVSDIDADRAGLVRAGIEVSEIEELPGVVRWCDFSDLWGNRLGPFTDLARF